MPGRFPSPPEGSPPPPDGPQQPSGYPPQPPGYPPGNQSQPPGYQPQATGHYPLDMNHLFEMTFSLFRFNSRRFLAMTFIVMIPVSLLLAASTVYTSDAALDWIAQFQRLASGGEISLSSFPWAVIGVGILIGIVVGIGTYVAQAAVTHAALNTYGGGKIDARSSARYALGRFGSLAGAYLLTFLAGVAILVVGAMVATILFLSTSSGGRIVPGIGVFLGLTVFVASFAALIFISIRWALVIPTVVAEGAGARKALGRSWRLVSGSSWRVLGYLLAFGLIFGLIAALLTLVITLVVDPGSLAATSFTRPVDPVRVFIVNLGSGLIAALVLPFPAIGMTLLYLDLRWRRGEPVPQPGEAVPSPPAT